MKILFTALLLFISPVIAGEIKQQDFKHIEIIKAEFGLIENNQLIPSEKVPLIIGQTYGWRIELNTNKPKIKWREQFILPKAPKTWGGVNKIAGSNAISTDKRVSITEREVIPENGVISNAWSVVQGDPTGRYMIRVIIENQQERVFTFDVETPTIKKSY
ncbi:hypothetical protein DOJK_00722 [Patescibacteria group bacterium]|nr:hypothetical protein DOJK_00722 [Patescibacteria group bacterium]